MFHFLIRKGPSCAKTRKPFHARIRRAVPEEAGGHASKCLEVL